jgi:hypothetical protein
LRDLDSMIELEEKIDNIKIDSYPNKQAESLI